MKRYPVAAMLTLLCVFAAPLTIRGRQVAPKKLTAEETFAEIKKMAIETAKANSATIKKPVFEYNENGKLLEYYLGGVRVGSFELEADDPYLLPFEKQIQIEALRDLLKRRAPEEEENYWGPPLALAEQLLLDAVRDVLTTSDNAALKLKLEARSNLVDSAFTFLHLSIVRLAKDKGYTAKRVGDRGLASDTFTVQVVTDPSGGRVRVMPWVKYVKCSRLKQCGDVWPWRELVSESEGLIGEYFYQAEWSGGRRNEDRIEVRNSTTLTFRPKP